MGLHILYEDEEVAVLKKDAGIPVQSGKARIADVQGLLKNELFRRHPEKGEPYLGIVHRLDQPVEGVLVFAKTPFAARELSRQVTDGTMKKYYLALLCGRPEQKEGTLVDYLQKDSRTNTSKVVGRESGEGKRSELKYRVLGETKEGTLTEIELLTGRHHQIRVQMASRGWPLFGDTKYNPAFWNTERQVQTALCAWRLSFVHPRTKKRMEFTVEPENPVLRGVCENA